MVLTELRQGTLSLLRNLNVIHSVCDEPQAGEGSIPLVPETTRADKVLFRLHGRNVQGWRNTTGDDQAWRKVRYFYNYSDEELEEVQNAVRNWKRKRMKCLLFSITTQVDMLHKMRNDFKKGSTSSMTV